MKDDEPKISVIIPVYNVEKYLKEALDSLLNQTYQNFEVICIDDSSTDKSLEILKEYAHKDKRFIVCSQSNQGQGIARNKALEMVRGEYIFFLDPDDWIDDNTFEILINKFNENKDVQIIQYEYITYDEKKQESRKSNLAEKTRKTLGIELQDNKTFSWKDSKTHTFVFFNLAVWNRMYSAKFIKDNNILFAPNKHGEDQIFSIKSIVLADKVLYIQNPLYHYRVRIGSAVNKATKENMCVFENIEYLREFLIEQNLFVKLEEQFINYKIEVLQWHYCCIPKQDIEEYLERCKTILTTDEYNKFRKRTKGNFSLLEKIFAFKNKKIHGIKYKVVKILWFEFLFEPKSKRRT